MTDVRAQDHVMAWMQLGGVRLAFDPEMGPAAQHEDPLVGVLVEPLARRGDVAGRHDPLDTQTGRAEQDVDLFGGQTSGEVVEQVAQTVSIASRFLSRAGHFW
jgi:hypothetical protein